MAQAKLTSYLGAHHERADAAEGIHPAAHGRDCRVHVGGPGLLSPLRPLGQLAAGDHAQPDAVFLHRLRPLFGEPYAEAGTTDRSFTGKDEDTTSGMYDFLERRYNPTAGRWLSPDPAGLGAVDPTNPQTWNRYSYVMNNPLALIDLIGEECYAGDGNGGCYNNGSGGGGGLAFSGLWGDPFAVMQIPQGQIPLWGWVPNTPNSGVHAPSNPLADSITVTAYWGQIGSLPLFDGTMALCALFCGSNGNVVFNGVYPSQPPTDSVGPAPKPPVITPEQAKALCNVAVQLRYNGYTPINIPSGDPNYSVDQGTKVAVGPRSVNPRGATAGDAAQAAAAAVSIVVGKTADMNTCMGFYRNN